MIKIKVRTRDKLEALTSNKDYVNVFGERRARVRGNLSRKKVENPQTRITDSQTESRIKPRALLFLQSNSAWHLL